MALLFLNTIDGVFNYLLIYFLIAMGIISFLLLFFYIHFKLQKLENSNKNLVGIIVKLEHVIQMTNNQISESIEKIGKGTNGAIDQFTQVLQLSDTISKDIEKAKDIFDQDPNSKQVEILNSIRKNSHKQNEKLFQVISELQFEDITRQINTHITNLLDMVTEELKNQKKIYLDLALEEEIKKKVVENYLQFTTMKSERDIASLLVSDKKNSQKNTSESDVTFF